MPPGSSQGNLAQEDLREIEGGKIRGRERSEILLQATVQGTISLPRRCLYFRRILDIRDILGLLYKIFTPSWPDFGNVSITTSTAAHWK